MALAIARPDPIVEPFTVIVDACIFGGRYGVTILPRQVDRPTLEFRTKVEAIRHAEAISIAEGWPLRDLTDG